jgi:hypothetical protein
VFLFHGTEFGLAPWRGISQKNLGSNDSNDRFGEALAVGDFDGDGRADLAVGAPGEKPGSASRSGWVFTYRGDATGLTPWKGFGQQGLGSDDEGDRFGEALGVGDFDGDGRADLAVGAPGEKPGSAPRSGWVFTYRGGAAGLTPWKGFGQQGLGSDDEGDRFGEALGVGDFDGDGRADLTVGAPGEKPGSAPRSGWVFTYRGAAAGLTPWRGLGQEGLGSDDEGDRFGEALAVGDFDGDGRVDLVVGAPHEIPGNDPRSGYAFAFNGSTGANVFMAGRGIQQEQ